jgi:hypothetical protein
VRAQESGVLVGLVFLVALPKTAKTVKDDKIST